MINHVKDKRKRTVNLINKVKAAIWVILIAMVVGLYPSAVLTQEPFLVKDINQGIIPGRGSDPAAMTEMNGVLFFTADDGVHGRELWRSDGSEQGTLLVKDIRSGSSSSIGLLTEMNGMLFFPANDGQHGDELWKSDGSEQGTVLVKDIRLGSASFVPPTSLTEVNGMLFFYADDWLHGVELWKSDGSEQGTVLVKDIRPGYGSSGFFMFEVNGTLFLRANDGVHGDELWKSDGSEQGTVLVKDIRIGWGSDPVWVTAANGMLFFTAKDGVHGRELWKSDGTEVGTLLIKDIKEGFGDSFLDYLGDVNGVPFFSGNDGLNGYELWKSDGSEAGTVLVKDINPGTAFSYPGAIANVNGTHFFVASEGIHGSELWKTDGSEAGTVLVKDINPGISWSIPAGLTNVNGMLFFVADDGVHGHELWKSDGLEAGTVLVRDINPGTAPSGAGGLINVNGTLFFVADDGVHGSELWRSDGTEVGTMLVKDINPGSGNSYVRDLTEVNGTLYFTADDGVNGRELWALTQEKLNVTFKVLPEPDPGVFALQIDGIERAAGIMHERQMSFILDAGEHTIGVSAGSSTILSDYVTVFGGDCDPNGNLLISVGKSSNCNITMLAKSGKAACMAICGKLPFGMRGDCQERCDQLPQQSKLKVNLEVMPPDDPGKFNLQVNGINRANNVRNGGTTGPIAVNVGAHKIGLTTDDPNTDLDNYFISFSDNCSPDGTVLIPGGYQTTCTVTVSGPKLTLRSRVLPLYDQGVFDLEVDGVPLPQANDIGNEDITVSLIPGVHTISVSGGAGTNLADYTTTINGSVRRTFAVTLMYGDQKTCTITNTAKSRSGCFEACENQFSECIEMAKTPLELKVCRATHDWCKDQCRK